MNLSPIQLLREAIRAVPPLKYALGVVGLVAVIAIVGAFRIRPEIAALGSVTTLVLMVALLIFARLTKTAKKHFLVPALVLMWSFLVLVIAAAGLLFLSTFFGWPMNFRVVPRPAVSGNVDDILKTAKVRLGARDYEGAWKTLQNAAATQPRSEAVVNAQADVAMDWLRHIVVRVPHTFTEIVDQVTPSLYSALSKAKGTRAGDLSAHIGWSHFLRARENPTTVNIDAEYRKALEYDPQNTYAHTMLAHHLMQRPGNVAEARRHFDSALATKREHEWVREMQIYVLRSKGTTENRLELARVANEMRANRESLPDSERSRLFDEIYWFGAAFADCTNLLHILPATEHLATFKWLAGAKTNYWPEQHFILAGLTEQSGDYSNALKLYSNLGSRTAEFDEEARKGIARCNALAKTK